MTRIYTEVERIIEAANHRDPLPATVVIRWATKVIPALEARGYNVTRVGATIFKVSKCKDK